MIPTLDPTLESDGSYVVELPYADDRELIMNILKFGAEVEVLGPAALKKRVKTEIGKMVGRYE
jgi:predicted DNA-binding transcriptional regulator YafY